MAGRTREYCWTLNNWTEEEYDHIRSLTEQCRYIVIGKEIGEQNGTPHLQGYIVWKDPKSWARTCKLLGKRVSNVKQRYEESTPLKASEYCKKDGNFFEHGDLPHQGARNDLIQIRDEISSGATSVEDILIANPIMYHQYGRTLERLEDVLNRKKCRTWMTQGIWLTGPSGSGKTHKAFELAGGMDPTKVYVHKNDNGWWDAYKGQETVIINEFRGCIQYAELLELTDKWYCTVRRRGREPTPFLAKRIIVTSILTPEEVYHNLSEGDSLEQLERRFEIIKLEPRVETAQKCPEGNN